MVMLRRVPIWIITWLRLTEYGYFSPQTRPLFIKCHAETQIDVNLGENRITEKDQTKHIGLIRKPTSKVNTEERPKASRKTIYALLGQGLHAMKGTTRLVAVKLCKTYALPRSL